jgi:hypothetical protein
MVWPLVDPALTPATIVVLHPRVFAFIAGSRRSVGGLLTLGFLVCCRLSGLLA